MTRPRGGDWLIDDLRTLQEHGVDLVVSMLIPGEMKELGLRDEEHCCKELGLDYVNVPVEDRGVPDSARCFCEQAKRLDAEVAAGQSIAIHCRAGIGRSSLMAVAVLVVGGLEPDDAWSAVERARGCSVPDTSGQRQWLHDFARALPVLLELHPRG